jgi:hypothetical protein
LSANRCAHSYKTPIVDIGRVNCNFMLAPLRFFQRLHCAPSGWPARDALFAGVAIVTSVATANRGV